jgi:hypothetical protein
MTVVGGLVAAVYVGRNRGLRTRTIVRFRGDFRGQLRLEIATDFLQSSQHLPSLLADLGQLLGSENNQAQERKEDHFR